MEILLLFGCPITVWYIAWLEGEQTGAAIPGSWQFSGSVFLAETRREQGSLLCRSLCLGATLLCGRGVQKQTGMVIGLDSEIDTCWENWSLLLEGSGACSLPNPYKVKYALNWTAEFSDDHKSVTSYFLSSSQYPKKLRPLVHPGGKRDWSQLHHNLYYSVVPYQVL